MMFSYQGKKENFPFLFTSLEFAGKGKRKERKGLNNDIYKKKKERKLCEVIIQIFK